MRLPKLSTSLPFLSSRYLWLGLLLALGAGLLAQSYFTSVGKTAPSTTARKALIPEDKIVSGGPPKDGIPSIDQPKFASVFDSGWLGDNDLLLTVSLEGQTKAYPIRILVWHEIVNDKLGQTPVVVTWCPLCGSGLAFERLVDGAEVEFGVSGLLYNSDLLMYDRKTDSLWSQITGQAVVGPRAGDTLTRIPLNIVRWIKLKSTNAQALVLTRETGFDRDYNNSPYGNYDQETGLYFPVESEDDRLHPKERVVGLEIDGQHKAYVLAELEKKGKISDEFAGKKLTIEIKESGEIEIKDDAGQIYNFTHTFWFAWAAFYPQTELWKG